MGKARQSKQSKKENKAIVKMEKPISEKSATPSTSAKQSLHKSVSNNHFALKLHRLLSQPSYNDIMCWTPNGDAFCILNETLFVERIMSVHFQNAKFESFSRRLRRWGFKRIDVNGKIPKIHGMAIFQCEFFKKGQPELCEFICDERQLKNKRKRQTGSAICSNGLVKADGKEAATRAAAIQVTLKNKTRQPEVKNGLKQEAGVNLSKDSPQHQESQHDRLGFFSSVAVAASEASSSSPTSIRKQPERIVSMSQRKNSHQEIPQLLLGKRQHVPITKSPVTSTQITSTEPPYTPRCNTLKEKEQGFSNNHYHFAPWPNSSLSASSAMLPPYNFGRDSDESFMARSLMPRNLLPHDIRDPGPTFGGPSNVFHTLPDGNFETRGNPQIMETQLLPRPHAQSQLLRDPFLFQQTNITHFSRYKTKDTAADTVSNNTDTLAIANNTSYSEQLQLLHAAIQRDRRMLALRQSIQSCEEELALVSRLRRLKEEQIALQMSHQYYQHD